MKPRLACSDGNRSQAIRRGRVDARVRKWMGVGGAVWSLASCELDESSDKNTCEEDRDCLAPHVCVAKVCQMQPPQWGAAGGEGGAPQAGDGGASGESGADG